MTNEDTNPSLEDYTRIILERGRSPRLHTLEVFDSLNPKEKMPLEIRFILSNGDCGFYYDSKNDRIQRTCRSSYGSLRKLLLPESE